MGDATTGAAGAGGADVEAPSTPGSKGPRVLGWKLSFSSLFPEETQKYISLQILDLGPFFDLKSSGAISKEPYMPCLMPLPLVSLV